MTVAELINSSLRLIGVLAVGETPSIDDQNDALQTFNDLIESWSTESLNIYYKARVEHTLVSGTQTYTIGSGGDINTTRPIKIEDPVIAHGSSQENEFSMKLINQKEWTGIAVKDTSSSIPRKLFYQPNNPLGRINLWPKPNAANKLRFYAWVPLATYSSLSTSLALPPGYQRALRFNLALELAPEYGKEPSQTLYSIAMESKANIKRANVRDVTLKADAAVLAKDKSWNWLTGE